MAALEKHVGAIKGLRHPLDQKGEGTSRFCSLLGRFLHIFSLCQIQKTHESLLILPSSPKIKGIVLILNLLFLGSTPWIWGLRVWM